MPRGFGFADIGRAVLDLQGRLGPGKPAAYEGYTRGEWEFDPGDTGDPSVGMAATPPSIYVELKGEDDQSHTLELAQPLEPLYSVHVDRCTPACRRHPEFDVCEEGHNEYDEGMRAAGNVNANGTLMANSPRLFELLLRARRDDPHWRDDADNLIGRLREAGVY